MALMEYCLVNIVLGDSDAPKPPEKNPPNNLEKTSKENSLLLTSSKPPSKGGIPLAIRQRNNAINIDRFSRVFFPLLFTVLNCTYWILFAEYI